ncbi:fimbria/pilus periplasmic chaperone [Klebsiella pneumoniae]|nr:fimbria/pilus periplasmic chaperone [Klebsiella pneumoniae]MTW92444.1 fimbria/pilus periplasmic chaperone [Klebsiella pneumoniae]
MFYLKIALTIVSILYVAPSFSGVVIGGTRLIFNGEKKDSSINLANEDKVNYLIQSWVENEDGTRDNTPFIITPPLFRLNAEEQNVLRVIKTNDMFSDDREQLYWINVKSIPSTSKELMSSNSLQIAIKTRIKLIYRPASLYSTQPEDVAQLVKWSMSEGSLRVSNPTGYYMNFNSIKFNGLEIKNTQYVSPKATTTYKLSDRSVQHGTIEWSIINDYGGVGKVHSVKI